MCNGNCTGIQLKNMRQAAWLLIHLLICSAAFSQPGPMPAVVSVSVFYQDKNIAIHPEWDFRVEWLSEKSAAQPLTAPEWKRALIKNGVYCTGPVQAERAPVQFRIFSAAGDTMYVTTYRHLIRVPFQRGHFYLSKPASFLVNMEAVNGTVIRNQQWSHFRDPDNTAIPVLPRTRFYYYPPDEMEMEEELKEGISNGGYRISAHASVNEDDGLLLYVEPGILYHAPLHSPAVYTIGYITDEGEEKLGISGQYLMQSTDQCRSWQLKFPLGEEDAALIGITANGFLISGTFPDGYLYHYNQRGEVIDSVLTDESFCENPQNLFGECGEKSDLLISRNSTFSDPVEAYHGLLKSFHRRYTQNGKDIIELESLPYQPERISRSTDGGLSSKPVLELNSRETYVYLTMRKNKLVLLSYNYTMISTDSGNTWTFYRTGSFAGGNWNFIWLDDNTLVNVTNEYADMFLIR